MGKFRKYMILLASALGEKIPCDLVREAIYA